VPRPAGGAASSSAEPDQSEVLIADLRPHAAHLPYRERLGRGQPVLPVPPDADAAPPLFVPAAYGDYRAERFAARGGMGLVLQGRRMATGQPVAIKLQLPGAGLDRRDTERFRREVGAMARVRHPNVVELLHCGKVGPFHYLVVAWVEGPSLARLIADANRGGIRPDFGKPLNWIEQVCRGVAAIHAAGLVHHDLKPSNILIAPGEVPRVADFGVARRVDGGATVYTATGRRLGDVRVHGAGATGRVRGGGRPSRPVRAGGDVLRVPDRGAAGGGVAAGVIPNRPEDYPLRAAAQ
jgi:serine/threonine protein kinase